MPEQMSADFEQVMAQCSRGCFTGLLRVRTREGNGEVRFLSGIQDGIRFDSMEGDEALERLLSASDPEFEAISSLPPIDLASTEPVPPEGRLERYHAAQLMRYCESNSLTCALELEVEARILTARYRLGELLSVEPDSEHTARLAEAKVGLYRFRLPRFELPANVQQRRPVSVAPKPAAAPVAAKPAPVAAAPVAAAPAPAARPAPAAAAPAPAAAAPVAARPVPVTAKPTPASLAETPLVAMRPVAIVTPAAGPVAARAAQAPVKAAAPPAAAAPSAPKVAAEARPAPSPARSTPASMPPATAGSPRHEGPRLGPSAVTPQPGRVADRSAPTQPPAAVVRAAASPAAPQSPAAPLPPPVSSRPPPRSPAPPSTPAQAHAQGSAQVSAAGSAQAKPPHLQGLWTDAVKPPPQSAPLELDGALRSGAAGGANKPIGRAEGLSSIAYRPTEEPVVPSAPPHSSSRYWLFAIAFLILVAILGWLAFGR